MCSKPGLGWIEVICGCMYSGKSEELVRRVRRAEIAKQTVQVFKHELDTRYAQREIAAHSGARLDAVPVRDSVGLLSLIESDTEVVAIDEGQFFDDGLVSACQELAARGLRVIVAGLDTDFRYKPFGPMPQLLALAERVDKLQAVCMVCHGPATRTQRLIDGKPAAYDDSVILVGASEIYEARCRGCHEVAPARGG